MLKNISNFHLFIVLIVLVSIYTIKQFTSGPQRSKGFTPQFVNIDKDAISSISFKKGETTFSVEKENGNWIIKDSDDKSYTAQESKVENVIDQLVSLKASRVASRKEEKWADFQVDSSGLNVEIYQGDTKSLDLIIGRFGIKNMQARQFQTYVRLEDKPEVLVCEDFFGASFSDEVNDFRDNRITNLEKDNITQITFNYPADSSFVLSKQNDTWQIGDTEADSADVAAYLSKVWSNTSYTFANDFDANTSDALYSMDISETEKGNVTISAYQQNGNWYVTSSQNPEAVFEDSTMVSKLFVGSAALLQE